MVDMATRIQIFDDSVWIHIINSSWVLILNSNGKGMNIFILPLARG